MFQVRRPNQRNSKIEAVKCAKLMHVSTARQAKGRQNKFGGDTQTFPFAVVAKPNDGRSSSSVLGL